jgi:ArsR family transcriptional regulator
MNKNIDLLKALSQKTRYLIVKELSDKELCACEIPKLINKTQSNTSMQLAKLTKLGVLQSRKDGKKILYSIKNKKVLDILKILES